MKIATIVATAFSVAMSAAQQAQKTEPAVAVRAPYTLQVNAQAVLLDVVVTDKKGNPVEGLAKDDFTVLEDGVAQTIKTLDRSALELPPPSLAINSTAELDSKAPNAPVNIVVLDEVDTRFEDEAFARYSLRRFLDTQGPNLPPTMLVAVDINHFMVLQDFTTSKDAILASLRRIQVSNPLRIGSVNWQAQQLSAELNSLVRVSQATSGHKGRKTMIWIGRGFAAINPNGINPEQAQALNRAIQECTNAMLDARVVLYTLDPAGVSVQPVLRTDIGFSEDPFGRSVDLARMARASGGKSFSGRNDVDRLIAASAREGTSFYTLSYEPNMPESDAKPFRTIKVMMKAKGLVASTRIGYYSRGSGNPEPVESADGTISHRLLRDLSLAGDGIIVYDAVPFGIDRDKKNQDSFELKVPSSELDWKPDAFGNLTSEVSLLVKVFDRKGNLLARDARLQKLEFPAVPGRDTPRAKTTALPITIGTALPVARIRIALRVDSTGRIGTNNYFLADPKTLEDPSIGLRPTR